MVKRLAIVGTGLSGWATARGILACNPNVEITFFHKNSEELIDKEKSARNKKSKSHIEFSRVNSIQYRRFGKKRILKLPDNSGISGWAKYWGATVESSKYLIEYLENLDELHSLENFEEFAKLFPTIERNLVVSKKNLDTFNVSDPIAHLLLKYDEVRCSDFQISPSRLAIYTKNFTKEEGCIECGKCLSGCPTNQIFETEKLIKDLFEKDDRIMVCQSTIEYIEKTLDGKYELKILESDKISYEPFDLIVIAAGAHDTISILAKSGYITNARFSESRMIFIPLIKFKPILRKLNNSSKITLSEAFYKQFKFGKIEVAGQIYSINPQILELKFPKIVNKSKILRNFFHRHFLVMMLFLPDDGYSFVHYDHSLKQFLVRNNKSIKYFKPAIRELKHNFRKLGYYAFISRFLLQPSGLSYHYGKGEYYHHAHSEFNSIVDTDYKLTRAITSDDIYISSVLNLREAIPGPITSYSLLGSYSLGKKLGINL